jgi:AcrR family transcriptional regulator
MPNENENALSELLESSDINEALRYYKLRTDNPGMSMEEIAGELGISRATLYRRISTWQSSGTIDRIQQIVLLPQLEELGHVVERAIGEFPRLVDLLIADAKATPKSDERLRIVQFLWNEIVKPARDAQPKSSSDELDFVAQAHDFNPVDIADVEFKPVLPDTN